MVLEWEAAKELQHLDNQGSQLVVIHQAGVVSEGYNLNKQAQKAPSSENSFSQDHL